MSESESASASASGSEVEAKVEEEEVVEGGEAFARRVPLAEASSLEELALSATVSHLASCILLSFILFISLFSFFLSSFFAFFF